MRALRTCRAVTVALLVATTAGCASMHPSACPPGQQEAVQELLYFGADKPAGQVTPQNWSDFLADTVTPRFPAGLTTWQASGQWRSDAGSLVREPSYVLSLVHPPGAGSETAIGEIVDAYKRRFHQEAVLRVRSPACMSL